MTSGPRKPSGTASPSFAHGWLNMLQPRSRKAGTCSLKASSSAAPMSLRTARGRSPRPQRLRLGRFKPMSCASSIAANQNRKSLLPAPIRNIGRGSVLASAIQGGLGFAPRPLFCASISPEERGTDPDVQSRCLGLLCNDRVTCSNKEIK